MVSLSCAPACGDGLEIDTMVNAGVTDKAVAAWSAAEVEG